MLIIDDLLLLPVQMLWKVCEGVRDEADKVLYPNEEQCKEKLLTLQMALEAGQITEEDYEAEEEKLMERWGFLQEYRKEEAGK
ncbi:MAG: gas vesicle protein GvpG [Candidatus Aerophobetes bacterium]|nr:gas vesicle protein GvpG [Candidatus Aerophobetes bacterium]